jgi:hypothetical protein
MADTNAARRILIGLFERQEFKKSGTGVSFARMAQELSRRGVEPRGRYAIHPAGYPHMVVWMGMSLAFKEAVLELLSAGTITLKLASPLVYLLDGDMPAMPVAESVCVKNDHWLPAVAEYHGE